MSEKFKNHESQRENDSEFYGLSELPAFNPEQNQENIDKAKEQLEKKLESEKPKFDARLTGLQVMSEQPKVVPVEELSEKDAAQEYLDLLMDLSSGFTSPEGKASRVVAKERDGSERIIGRGYDTDSRFAEPLLARATSKEELKAIKQRDREGLMKGEFRDPSGAISSNEYLDRAHSLKLADSILSAEASWRRGGEMFDQEKYDEAKNALEAYKEKDSKKFFLTKLFTRGKRKRELAALEQTYAEAGKGLKVTADADRSLQGALSEAYDEEYGYGSHKEAYGTTTEEKSARNEKFNNQFFSKENQEKIERAIALRDKLYPPTE